MQILSKYFVTKSQFKHIDCLNFEVEKLGPNHWFISNSVIKKGHLVKISPTQYYLMFDMFLENYGYDSFKNNYAFFYTDDSCRTFDTYVEDTDTGTVFDRFVYYDCQKQLDVCTWQVSGQFKGKNVSFIEPDDKITLVLISNKDNNGYDVSVTVGYAVAVDASEIIGELP